MASNRHRLVLTAWSQTVVSGLRPSLSRARQHRSHASGNRPTRALPLPPDRRDTTMRTSLLPIAIPVLAHWHRCLPWQRGPPRRPPRAASPTSVAPARSLSRANPARSRSTCARCPTGRSPATRPSTRTTTRPGGPSTVSSWTGTTPTSAASTSVPRITTRPASRPPISSRCRADRSFSLAIIRSSGRPSTARRCTMSRAGTSPCAASRRPGRSPRASRDVGPEHQLTPGLEAARGLSPRETQSGGWSR